MRRSLSVGSVLIAVAALVLMHGDTTGVTAQEATPTAVHLDVPINIDATIGLIRPDSRITWQPVQGVNAFRLQATFEVTRVNRADPLCGEPQERTNTVVMLDESLPGTATEFLAPFPPLPEPDAWFVYNSSVRLDAIDATGAVVGGGGAGSVSETLCGREEPTPTSVTPAGLPATGTGGGRGRDGFGLLAGLAAGVLLLATTRFTHRREH